MSMVICFKCGEGAEFDRERSTWRHTSAPPEAPSLEDWDRDHQVLPAEDD